MTAAVATVPAVAPGPRTWGLLFSAPMVRALRWRPQTIKTETRRLPNRQNMTGWGGLVPTGKEWKAGGRAVLTDGAFAWSPGDDKTVPVNVHGMKARAEREPYVLLPRVRPGDRIFVKETWAPPASYDGRPLTAIPTTARRWYRADHDLGAPDGSKRGKWRSSMFMPKVFSRIWLTVRDVEVQRLHDLTPAEARAEGIPQLAGEATALGLFDPATTPGHEWDNRTSVENYARLWDAINGAGSWAENPVVFVYRFTVEVTR